MSNDIRATSMPHIEQVRAEIADFQQRIRAAGEPDSPEFVDALLTYAPFLRRRFLLLAQLDPLG